ncbi:hypothetical protein [Aeromonas caviae]|uniref:hypothetical protein n=1 Tax=Aeromonas TaxID=642 RepID=UPI000FE320BB|nr:hypothetical protein [Aeromonas caviae]
MSTKTANRIGLSEKQRREAIQRTLNRGLLVDTQSKVKVEKNGSKMLERFSTVFLNEASAE